MRLNAHHRAARLLRSAGLNCRASCEAFANLAADVFRRARRFAPVDATRAADRNARAPVRVRMRRASLAWVASGLLAGHCAAVSASDYLTDSWSGDDGLPNSSVTTIAQTPEGYLWIGTLNGLARFDGVRFVNFDPVNTPELKHARVFRLFVDPNGTLWINTFDGSLTSWRDGTFTHEWRGWDGLEIAQVFTCPNDLVFAMWGGELVSRSGPSGAPGRWEHFKPAGLTTGLSYRQDRSGALWYITRDGAVGRLTGASAQILDADRGLDGATARCLETDPKGRIWVGTDRGIAVWDGQRFENRTPTNGAARVNVSLLFFLRDDACWAVADNRVRQFSGRRWVAEAEGWGELFGDYMPGLVVREDDQGGTWFCHYGQGVFHASPDGTFRRLTSAEGLPGDRVACWLQDREGNVWLGVDRGGLVRLREKRFQVIGPAQGLPVPGVISVCEDPSGAVWIASYGGGLNRWQEGRLERFTLPKRPTRGFFFSVYPDAEGGLWLSAGREDLFRLEQGRIAEAPWTVHGIKCTLVDRQGRVWLGKKSGLSRISNGVLESFGQTTGFDHTLTVHALAEDAHGNIWVGAGNGVLYRFRDGRFTSLQAADKLGGQAIWSLLPEEDGTVWVGTFRGGLLRFKDGEFTRYTTENGLPSDVICQILDDNDGRLWIGSHKGIFHVSKKALHEFAENAVAGSLPCVAYGTYDGLPTLECSGGYQPSAWRGRDGRLWFATAKGVVSVQPDDLPRHLLPPPVVLEELRVDGKVVSSDSWNPNRAMDGAESQLRIPPGRNFFEIRYAALSYVAPDQVRFRYRLEGLESDWVEAGGRREAYYSHLPPGNYTFHVTACNSDGVWNEHGAALAFAVLPHFYETRWFRVMTGMLAVALVAGTVRQSVVRRMRRAMERVERQRAVERDRARIAKDIHDDLGSGLTHIKLESELAQRDPSRQTRAHLGQIAELAQGLTRKIDEIVWAVDPERDTLAGFTDYATGYAEEFLNVADIRCRIDLPAMLPELHVDAETRYNLFLCLKEALNNVVRHSRATEVWLRLRVEGNGFTLVVEDNGCGMPEGTAQRDGERLDFGHGMSNLRNRLGAVGGRCAVRSVRGEGTRVEMSVRTGRAVEVRDEG